MRRCTTGCCYVYQYRLCLCFSPPLQIAVHLKRQKGSMLEARLFDSSTHGAAFQRSEHALELPYFEHGLAWTCGASKGIAVHSRQVLNLEVHTRADHQNYNSFEV